MSGTAGPITDVNVGLDGFTHGVPDDVAMVLVAPTGQALKLVDCVGDARSRRACSSRSTMAPADLPDTGAVSDGHVQADCSLRGRLGFPRTRAADDV